MRSARARFAKGGPPLANGLSPRLGWLSSYLGIYNLALPTQDPLGRLGCLEAFNFEFTMHHCSTWSYFVGRGKKNTHNMRIGASRDVVIPP